MKTYNACVERMYPGRPIFFSRNHFFFRQVDWLHLWKDSGTSITYFPSASLNTSGCSLLKSCTKSSSNLPGSVTLIVSRSRTTGSSMSLLPIISRTSSSIWIFCFFVRFVVIVLAFSNELFLTKKNNLLPQRKKIFPFRICSSVLKMVRHQL